MLYIQFIISAALIVFSGIKLTGYADALSDKLNIGKVWIGVILLGLVTSLPEAVASLTAVLALHSNDLAIGNMVGSNNFNISLIVLMDMFYRKSAITNHFSFTRAHLMPAVFAVYLTLFVIAENMLGGHLNLPMLGPVSLGNVIIIVVYFWGVRILSKLDVQHQDVDIDERHETISVKALGIRLFASAVCVVVGAIWLASCADKIAEVTGLGQTFVGTIFLAFVTSLPEMVVTISALRLGVIDMALGNIFGSNMINMFIVALCDVFYVKGAILATVSKTHVFTAGLSVFLTGIVLAGISHRSKKKIFGLGWDAWLILILFICGMKVLYCLK